MKTGFRYAGPGVHVSQLAQHRQLGGQADSREEVTDGSRKGVAHTRMYNVYNPIQTMPS